MKKRIQTSVLLGIVALLGLFYYPLFGIVVSLFIGFSLYEFFDMVEEKGVRMFKLFGILVGLFIPITIFFKVPIKEGCQFLFVVLGLFFLFLMELTKKKRHQPVLSLSSTVFGILYISWCFSFLIRIRQLEQGILLVAFLIIVTKAADIGAYFFGSRFGRMSLVKRVSPQKTLEGAVGGFVTSLVACFLFYSVIGDLSFFWEKMFISAVLAIVGQLGDLFESLIKRDCEIKDSGAVFPGMGGFLDVIDSLIFTAPTFYLYVTMLR